MFSTYNSTGLLFVHQNNKCQLYLSFEISHICEFCVCMCFGVLNAKKLAFSTPETITLNGLEHE